MTGFVFDKVGIGYEPLLKLIPLTIMGMLLQPGMISEVVNANLPNRNQDNCWAWTIVFFAPGCGVDNLVVMTVEKT